MRKTVEKFKKISGLVWEQIVDIYPFVLGFYFVCLLMSVFFERWKLFFQWTAFFMVVIALGLLSLLGGEKEKNSFRIKRTKRNKKKQTFFNRTAVRISITKLLCFWRQIRAKITILWGNLRIKFLKGLTKRNFVKLGMAVAILTFPLYKGIQLKGITLIKFLILTYGVIYIFFIKKDRLNTVIALLLLISCPVLLFLKKQVLAETMAVYVYCFLVIAVITQIREFWRERTTKKVIHSLDS